MSSEFHDDGCFYCTSDERLESLMSEVCKLRVSTIYLFHDQKHPGRCVVAFNGHTTEIFQLSDKDRQDFYDDVAEVAKVIYDRFEADKINYATYGDLVPHLHMHLVPKKVGGLNWGGPFTDGSDKFYLPNKEREMRINILRKDLKTSSFS